MLVDRDVTAAWYHAMPAGIAQSKAGRLLNPLHLAGRSCGLSTILTGIDFAPGNPALLRTTPERQQPSPTTASTGGSQASPSRLTTSPEDASPAITRHAIR